jgi:hypothetical protein
LFKLQNDYTLISSSFLASKAKNYYNSKINIFYLRHANNIIFYGFFNKETLLLIKNEVTNFLASRGFNLKTFPNNSIFQFKPNSTFSFLGFQYFFPSRFQKKKLKNGRFTKKRYTIFNIVKDRFNMNLRVRIFLIINLNICKIFKFQIRNIFKKKHFYLSVTQLISILNEKMKDFVLYFPSYLSVIQIQLNSLDNLIRK